MMMIDRLGRREREFARKEKGRKADQPSDLDWLAERLFKKALDLTPLKDHEVREAQVWGWGALPAESRSYWREIAKESQRPAPSSDG